MKENWQTHWQDYYEILQVSQLAEDGVVKAAYQNLASKYHPDHNSSAKTVHQMTLLNEAFYILGNSSRRKDYDANYQQLKNQNSTRQTITSNTDVTANPYLPKEWAGQSNGGGQANVNGVPGATNIEEDQIKPARLRDYISLVVLSCVLVAIELMQKVFSYWHISIYALLFLIAVAWEKWLKKYAVKTIFRKKIAVSIFLVISFCFYVWALWLFKEIQPAWYYVIVVASIIGLFLIWWNDLAQKIVGWLDAGRERKTKFNSIWLAIVISSTLVFAAYTVVQTSEVTQIITWGMVASALAIAAIAKGRRINESVKLIQKFGLAAITLLIFSILLSFYPNLVTASTNSTSHELLV